MSTQHPQTPPAHRIPTKSRPARPTLFGLVTTLIALVSQYFIEPAVAREPAREPGSEPARPALQPTPSRTPTPISVGNLVWDDLDGDGRQDAGEPGLAGITVQLWSAAKNALFDTTTTNGSGIYKLTAPVPGNYRVRVLLPNAAADQFSPLDAAGGDDLLDSDINPVGTDKGFTNIYTFGSNLISITSIDAGIRIFRTPTPTRTPTPINVGNFVWDDLDSDGRQDVGEPGLAGVTVQLWNGAKNALIDQTTTNANGFYTLIAPTPGEYRVRVLLPNPATDQFSPLDGAGGDDQLDSDINPSGTHAGFTNIYSFANNLISITTIDAGIRRYRTPTPTRTPTPVNIGNLVWNDLNNNGIQEAGEPGLAGVPVELWNADKTELIDRTMTNASGLYTLIAPKPDAYRIRVLLLWAAASFAPKDQGGDEQLDSDINPSGVDIGFTDVYTIASNVISTSIIDAGIYNPTGPTFTPEATYMPTATPTPDPLAATSTPSSTPDMPGPTGTPMPTITASNTPDGTPNSTPFPSDHYTYLPLILQE